MNLFKSLTLLWWQTSIFKIAAVAFGVIIGAYWSNFFRKHYWILWTLVLISAIYITYIWLIQ